MNWLGWFLIGLAATIGRKSFTDCIIPVILMVAGMLVILLPDCGIHLVLF